MVTSRQSKTFKHLNKLINSKKYRDERLEFVVFGDHLINEANKAGVIKEVFTSNENKTGTLISDSLLKSLSQTKTHFDELAICKRISNDISANFILILDDIQDPTNLGALLRSALAFNFKKVLISKSSADIYNDKVIRSSQGAFFHLNIKRVDVVEEINKIKDEGFIVLGADAHEGENLIPKNDKLALVLGNEGSGISKDVKSLLDNYYQIKTNNVESLNVGVAGAIIMYEFTKGRF